MKCFDSSGISCVMAIARGLTTRIVQRLYADYADHAGALLTSLYPTEAVGELKNRNWKPHRAASADRKRAQQRRYVQISMHAWKEDYIQAMDFIS